MKKSVVEEGREPELGGFGEYHSSQSAPEGWGTGRLWERILLKDEGRHSLHLLGMAWRVFLIFVVVTVVAGLVLAAIGGAQGQNQSQNQAWEMQPSHSTANLRGIHAVGGLVAWASGADGTVLRTENGGGHWQECAVPAGAEKLDFRGIWAWDAKTAMAMSAGPGEQSRVYKTTDGCLHWTEETRNSEKDGFWDAMVFQSQDFGLPGGWTGDDKTGVLLGDPVHGRFDTRVMLAGKGWLIDDDWCGARADESAFAASNTSVFVFGPRRYVVGTGGKGGPRVLLSALLIHGDSKGGCLDATVPLASGSDSAGVFSLAFRDLEHGIAVGGDYKKADDASGTAAWTADGGRHWTAAAKPPRGYRSAVAWDRERKVWIAAGTNGSDVSRDEGKSWGPLDNGNWNAISLPYVVGPGGRIGRLRSDAVQR
jgi:hypothetical protein